MTTVDDQEPRQRERGAEPSRPRSAWRRQYWVLLFAIYCIGFAIYGESRYLTFDPALSRALPPRADVPFQYPLLALHVLFGAVAITLAPLQVWPWLRERHPRVHRRIGLVYFLAGVFPAGILAVGVAILTTAGQSTRMSLFALSVLWLITTVAGFTAALRGRYDDHRRWMVRNVALTTSIVTARPIFYANFYVISWWLSPTYAKEPFTQFTQAYATGIWLSIIIHLVIAEWVILRPRRRARRIAPQRPAVAALID